MSDYRDKAAELRRQVVWASNEAIDTISHALLEAHEAGRAEMREKAAERADFQAEWAKPYYSGEGAAEMCRRIATAIRSIK